MDSGSPEENLKILDGDFVTWGEDHPNNHEILRIIETTLW